VVFHLTFHTYLPSACFALFGVRPAVVVGVGSHRRGLEWIVLNACIHLHSHRPVCGAVSRPWTPAEAVLVTGRLAYKPNWAVARISTVRMVSALERHLAAALHSRISRGLPNDLYPTSNLALVDFTSSEYLALSRSPELKQAFLEKLQSTPDILGSGGSRLLNHNILYEDLETRLQNFFNEGKGELEAIVFNSGLEANVGFFSWVPQRGDFIVYDLHIHASIHGGMRASKAQRFSFAHNSAQDLQKVLTRLKTDHPELVSGNASLFIALESIYSMDGSVVPLTQVVEMADSMFPSKNAYILVDEAHSTGLYGPQGRGLVSMLGLQDRVFARLHTFSKALSAAGG